MHVSKPRVAMHSCDSAVEYGSITDKSDYWERQCVPVIQLFWKREEEETLVRNAMAPSATSCCWDGP